MPPEPPRRRLPSAPDLPRAIAGDEQPERRAVRNHPGVEGADQAAPTRSSTLTGLPGPPARPMEHQRTVPARAHVAPTERAPTPAAGSQASLPPASQSPDRARIAAQERELDRLRAEKSQIERDARAAAEARLDTYPPRKIERAPSPSAVSAPIDDGSVESLRKALTKLVLGVGALLALLGTPLAIWVSNVAAEAKARAERATTQVAQASTEADAAKEKARVNAKDSAANEREFRQYRSNRRELDRLQGVEYPRSDGDPEPADLRPYTPLCQPPGRICTGPALILKNAP